MRLELRLNNQSEWIRIFDPRDCTVFVPTRGAIDPAAAEDSDSADDLVIDTEGAIDAGTTVRIALEVGGWSVTLRGIVVGRRKDPTGVVVAISATEHDKINYLNGFVRGGLLNLREKRRLPIKLQVTYGAVDGPASTFTKDINEDGLFLFTNNPLPETSQIHMLINVPGKSQPLSLIGKVSHTIIDDDDEPPGMGVVFEMDDAQREALAGVMKELEDALEDGALSPPSD